MNAGKPSTSKGPRITAAAVVASLFISLLVIQPTLPAQAAVTDDLRIDGVCFSVHNEGDPEASSVHGLRYYVGEPNPETPVIVLVHGHSVTRGLWDASPDFSVARNFARAGYLVIAYDRLGYGHSPYQRPRGAGYTLTWSSQRAMLHEVVNQVKAGSYTFGATDSCSGSGAVVGLRSPTVVVIGISAGGAIVSGYPGTYRDVAAAIQVGWSNQGLASEALLYVGQTLGPEYAKGNDYATLFPAEEGCRKALVYPPSVHPKFDGICRRNGVVGVPAPAGELAGFLRTHVENHEAIKQVGPDIPILLAFQDPDFFFSSDKNAGESTYWQQNCGCDVEAWTQAQTGHGLWMHTTMPAFTSKVVDWLGSKGLAP
jgi:pimeloyl-ACP methyl ester carboxylesterase